MKALWKKHPRKWLGLLALILVLCPVYMYFSHDVSELATKTPHFKLQDDQISYELKSKKPAHWVGLKSISRYGRWAIIFSEDWAFYQHDGVDFEQMQVALGEMMDGERFRGASTITQQLVKNVFLSNARTPWRKIHEIILAKKVDNLLTKDRILEVYLNSIEFGPRIYGIKNASQHYFKKHPSELTPREGAFLAMLLPSPKRYYVSFKKRKLTKFAKARIKAILIKMRMGKIITPEQYESELNSKMSWEN